MSSNFNYARAIHKESKREIILSPASQTSTRTIVTICELIYMEEGECVQLPCDLAWTAVGKV